MNKTIFIAILLIINQQAIAQSQLHSSPEDAAFITSDIENFWRAFDQAKGKSREEQLEIYRENYIKQATVGFKSYIEKRDKKVEELVDGINSLLPFYESIRADMLTIEDYEKEMRASFYALKYLYPKSVFPDTYFFVWYMFASGSTTSDEGLLMTMEAHSVNQGSPLDKFPPAQHDLVRSMTIENMPLTVAHELIHYQQPDIKTNSLLEKAVREGSADFVAELICGENPSIVTHTYANPREEELWNEFKQKMYGDDYSGWVGIPNDRPAGLSYWMGYKIIEAYYDKQPNKVKAVKAIIEAEDYQKIFEQSGYADKFQ